MGKLSVPGNRPGKWQRKYSGLDVNDLKKMKEVESELAQFKRIVADLTLQNRILKDVIGKKVVGPDEKRELINYLLLPAMRR